MTDTKKLHPTPDQWSMMQKHSRLCDQDSLSVGKPKDFVQPTMTEQKDTLPDVVWCDTSSPWYHRSASGESPCIPLSALEAYVEERLRLLDSDRDKCIGTNTWARLGSRMEEARETLNHFKEQARKG